MKLFKDKEGREWMLDINVDAIRRVRAALSINLLEVIEGKLIDRLSDDPVLLVDIIYVLCQPQAEQRNVSDVDFGRAMAGEAIDSATAAFFEDLTDFFPSGKRQMLKKILAKIETLRTTALARIDEKLDSRELDEALQRMLNNSSGDLQASWEQIQARSRSALSP